MSEHSFDDNPVAFELRTLRASVARFQEEAHASAVKLQRHSLDSAKLHERAVHLERENDLLKAELAVLRANPHPTDGANDSDARSQVQDLTLALRRLSHKLSSTEDALLSKTTELINAQAEMLKAKTSADNAYELGARVRGREEAALTRERHLQVKIVELEEDARIVDIALKEYAALVREMEAPKSAHVNSSDRKVDDIDEGARISATLLEGKVTRSRLLAQFEAQTAQLENELHGVRNELEVTRSLLDAEKKGTAALVQELGNMKLALEKLHLEDSTAAKMVSRYMQFSQTSTNALLSKLSAVKARHAGTLSTISSQNHSLTTRLRLSETQAERLLSALDELGGEIMRETWGRRREVGLRIRMGGREERIVEGLRRWVRRGDEMVGRTRGDNLSNPAEPGAVLDAFLSMAQDARIMLANLDEGVLDEEMGLSLSGSKARALLVNMGLEGLLDELKQETEKRILLEKQLAAMRNDSVSNGLTLNGRHVLDGAQKVEEGDTKSKILSSDLIFDGGTEKPPMVPEKPLIFAHMPEPLQPPQLSHPQVITVESSPNASEATAKLSNATTGRPSTDDIGLSTARELQPGPFPSMGTSPTSTGIETRDLQDSTLDDALKMDDSSPGLSNIAAIQLSTPNGSIEIGPKDDVPFGSPADIANSKTAVTIVEIPENLGVPSLIASATEESTKSSELLISTSISTLVEENIPLIQSIISHKTSTVPPILPNETYDNSIGTVQITTPTPEDPPPSLIPFPSSTIPIDSLPPSNPSLPSSTSPSPFTTIHAESKPHPLPPHPLLSELSRITKRYDDLQRAFRDCHIALESLKASLTENSPESRHPMMISADIFNAALRRLDDYTEDARVELEIRVSDEALLRKGYEALLSVPGALTTISRFSHVEDSHDDELPIQSDIEKQVAEFVDGTDSAVRRARETFTRKLEDVQHDIAALKRAIHDPESLAPSAPPPASSLGSLNPSSSTPTLVSSQPSSADLSNNDVGTVQSSGGWSSWIRGASSPSSAAPSSHGPAPTFGNIMTTPRLRHTPSSGNIHSATSQPQPARSRRPSFFSLGGGTTEPPQSPLAALELRVPMPNFVANGQVSGSQPLSAGSAGVFGGGAYGVLSPTSPLKSMTMAPAARVRTVSSTMYMLGLGAAGAASGNGVGGRMPRSVSAAGALVTPPSPLKGAGKEPIQVSSSLGQRVPISLETNDTDEKDEEIEEEEDTDVE